MVLKVPYSMKGLKEFKGRKCRERDEGKGVNTYTQTVLKGGTDIHTDGQTDQTDRLHEFHMLYGTKNILERFWNNSYPVHSCKFGSIVNKYNNTMILLADSVLKWLN